MSTRKKNPKFHNIESSTLSVKRLSARCHAVLGGDDGDVCVAAFTSNNSAWDYIRAARSEGIDVAGIRCLRLGA